MRRAFLLVAAVLVAPYVRSEAPSAAGSLPEDYLPQLKGILADALERSPTTIAAAVSIAQQEANKITYDSPYYPSLSGNMFYSGSHETEAGVGAASSTSRGLFYGISVNQSVFQWNAVHNQAVIGKLGVQIAQRQYADAYRSLAVNLREQYMNLITRKIAARNAQFNLKIADETLAAAQAKLESGAMSQAELGDIRINHDQTQLSTDRAQEDFAYTKRVFLRLAGLDDLPDDGIPLMIPHCNYSTQVADGILAEFVGKGVESTLQAEVYDLQLRQADLTYDIQKVRLLPKVYASASYNYSNNISLAPHSISQIGINSEAFSFNANWTIFDGMATRGAKLGALANKRATERAKKTYVDSTIDSVTYSRHQVDFSARAMAFQEVHNMLIAAEVKRFNEDQKLGYGSQAIIDAGTQNLYATEFDLAYARMGFLNQWTEYVSTASTDPALANLPERYVR